MKKTILIADDDKTICAVLSAALKDFPADIKITNSASELEKWIGQGLGDCVLSDVFMEDGNGIEILKNIQKSRPDLPVVIMSANSTVLTAIDAGSHGAFEYLPKPFDLDELKTILTNALQTVNQVEKNNTDLPIVGNSSQMQIVYRNISKLVSSEETVMINGESGTGKELVAKVLHDFSMRKDKPFVAINMGAIPKDLIEAELFGYEKGAFTGADNSKAGKFLQADKGTLFLDEIGDMPMEAQIRLLRVLQDKEVSPIGSSKTQKCDVRIIAATHKDLNEMVKDGTFREDLYYRLNVVNIDLPPLRERLEDIPDLVKYFVSDESSNKIFDESALTELMAYNWNGNVRELKNIVKRICLLSSANTIDGAEVKEFLANNKDKTTGKKEDLQSLINEFVKEYFAGDISDNGDIYDIFLKKLEVPLVQESLNYCNGNQIKTAKILGLNRNTIRKKIRDLGVEIIKNKNT
ncbi:MAG: sigma-54-dependent transcriptional regulator [Alphaproteobacteria bacterium]